MVFNKLNYFVKLFNSLQFMLAAGCLWMKLGPHILYLTRLLSSQQWFHHSWKKRYCLFYNRLNFCFVQLEGCLSFQINSLYQFHNTSENLWSLFPFWMVNQKSMLSVPSKMAWALKSNYTLFFTPDFNSLWALSNTSVSLCLRTSSPFNTAVVEETVCFFPFLKSEEHVPHSPQDFFSGSVLMLPLHS